jgi:hypothetical protein
VIYGLLQLPPWQEPWPSGSGSVAVIQFEAIFIPPPAADCDLTLFNVLLINADNVEIPYNIEDGHYTITVAPPPWLSVAPKSAELEDVGDTFDLNVLVNELDAGFRMVGAEFKVHYDTSYLATKEESITEGTGNIMREVADRIGEGLFFQAYVQEDYGLIGIILLPLPDGTWPYYPEGSGVLAEIEFEAIAQLETEDITTLVTVDEVLLVDSDAKEIPLDELKTSAEGTCIVTIAQAYVPPVIPPAEKSVDLFTQYAVPYGGQGYHVPSDAFGPQGQIMLYARVIYRGDGVPYKPVVYRILGPNGLEIVGTAFSDSEGLALMTANVPASPEYFGLWEVTASVDIAGEVVTDYLPFRVGWLVGTADFEVVGRSLDSDVVGDEIEVTPEGLPILLKGNQYAIQATMSMITMQNPAKCVQLAGDRTPLLILAYSGFDELKQAFFYAYQDITGDIEDHIIDMASYNETAWEFVVQSESDFTPRLHELPLEYVDIPYTAFSGVAIIYANFLTDYPAAYGVPYSDPTEGALQVYIRALPSAPIPTAAAMLSVTSEVLHSMDYQTFVVEVRVNDVPGDLHIVGIQFELELDTSLLEVLDVIEGPFVQHFGDTFFTWYWEENVIVGELQLPPWPGDNGWMNGGGLLATIEFGTSYNAPPSRVSELTLVNAFMVNADGAQVDFLLLGHGYVEIIP